MVDGKLVWKDYIVRVERIQFENIRVLSKEEKKYIPINSDENILSMGHGKSEFNFKEYLKKLNIDEDFIARGLARTQKENPDFKLEPGGGEYGIALQAKDGPYINKNYTEEGRLGWYMLPFSYSMGYL
jgi:hypothetical protein